jgi:hypothetical protein
LPVCGSSPSDNRTAICPEPVLISLLGHSSRRQKGRKEETASKWENKSFSSSSISLKEIKSHRI